MKKINLFFLSCLLFGAISCSSDDDNQSDTQNNVDPNPVEETALNANTVSKDISIEGATRITGAAPTPNGDIPFSMSETTQSGFLNSGFDISFSAPQNYAGAYLLIKSNDGTMASDYFDVPKSTALRSAPKKSANIFSKQSKVDNNIEIEVDFGNAIPPGKFCYLLCIYDDNGNISEPVEVCVEVEAWGGNSALVGTWNYTKQIENGVTILPGEKSECEDITLNCSNNQELVVEDFYCYILDSFKLTINSDGTYEYRSDDTNTGFNYSASTERCEPVFDTQESGYYVSKGKWAYDEEEKRMTLVEFEYLEAYGDQVYEGTSENGYVDFDGSTVIDGSSMVIKFSYEENITYNIEFFLSK
ncbi:hypothetical protein [Aquimarina aquimarini]|uniref:hypothetical protein n=1 Tax=Aquimarina aquimarini TaxID=1191734 RepID=UPI000D56131E|nr:hypothetical protein [Aquimarina aquimarini]